MSVWSPSKSQLTRNDTVVELLLLAQVVVDKTRAHHLGAPSFGQLRKADERLGAGDALAIASGLQCRLGQAKAVFLVDGAPHLVCAVARIASKPLRVEAEINILALCGWLSVSKVFFPGTATRWLQKRKEPTCFFVWSHCPTVCIDVEELWLLTWRRVVLDEAKVVVAEVAARHAVLEASHAYAPKVACAPLLRDLILGPVSKTASSSTRSS